MAANEPIWRYGESVISIDDVFWSYGQSRFTGEGSEFPDSVIERDVVWAAGQTEVLMGSSYAPQPEWTWGQTYLNWELVEGVVFGQVELAGVVIG